MGQRRDLAYQWLRRAAALTPWRRYQMATGSRWRLLALWGAAVLAIGVLAGATTWAWARAIALILIIYLAPGLILVLATWLIEDRRRHRLGLEDTHPAGQPEDVWAGARSRFGALRAEYAGFECDPMSVLRLPALADVSVPSTAWFVEAFAQAQALETEVVPPRGHALAFVAAVDHAERAWRAARDAAERIRLSHLGSAGRAMVERVIKLLVMARDSDSDAERRAACARARSELARLDRAGGVHLPVAAQAALDAAARGELPAATGTA